jgi:hypothetical protein
MALMIDTSLSVPLMLYCASLGNIMNNMTDVGNVQDVPSLPYRVSPNITATSFEVLMMFGVFRTFIENMMFGMSRCSDRQSVLIPVWILLQLFSIHTYTGPV